MKVGIIEAGRPPEEIKNFGSYPSMIMDWLQDLDLTFTVYGQDDFSSLEVDSNDMWVISGSRYSVYNDEEWIRHLENFVRDCYKSSKKMIGICFGHQLIAKSLGGVVNKNKGGWGVGIHQFYFKKDVDFYKNGFAIQTFNQDQIIKLPPQAKNIAYASYCQVGAAYYPNFAITFQGHPEFSKEYMQALVKLRGKQLSFTDDFIKESLAGIAKNSDGKSVLQVVKDFLANRIEV